MTLSPRIPTIDASTRVLPDLYDFYAEHNPDLPWAVYPASDTTTSSISFSEIVRASHRVAHLLGRREGDGTRDVVVMLIHCDTILYVTMLLGIARAGMVVRDFRDNILHSLIVIHLAFPHLSSKLS